MQTVAYLRKFQGWLDEPIDARVLGVYRILFGLFMAYNIFRYFQIELIKNMFVMPKINFRYDGFYWLKPLPEVYLNILLGLILVSALLITVGVMFKWACRFFAVAYLYIFLLDKSIYNNHIYLFILIAFLLSFTDADKIFSLGKKGQSVSHVPRWHQVILQVQIVIVYFYGGIAKITYDWIFLAQPVRSMVGFLSNDPLLSTIFENEAGILILNFGGLALDIGAPLLLWYKPLRRWSVWLFIGFNFTNSRLFQDIGIFPFVMLGNLILFYETQELPFFRKSEVTRKKKAYADFPASKIKSATFSGNTLTRNLLIGYFVFQFLFPFRGHFLPNPLDWATIGNRFSWRMKVDTRAVEEMKFFIYSSAYPEPVPVEIQTFINDMQMLNLSMDPRSVRDFALFLKREAKVYGTIDPIIKAEIELRYNGRAPAYFIDPDVDLTSVTYTPFEKATWVNPVPR